jgi:hypothetical protein
LYLRGVGTIYHTTPLTFGGFSCSVRAYVIIKRSITMLVEKRNVAFCRESTKLNQIQFYLLAFVYKEYPKGELFTAADVLLKVSKKGLYDQLVKGHRDGPSHEGDHRAGVEHRSP